MKPYFRQLLEQHMHERKESALVKRMAEQWLQAQAAQQQKPPVK